MKAGKLNLSGKMHRKMKQLEPKLEKLPLTEKYPVHKLPAMGLNYLALRPVEKIDQKPEDIFDYEWDNLVILDACRHDTYESVNGETDSRIARSSMSKGFIKENFSSGDYSDVVYITANPFFSEKKFKSLTGRELDEVFHEVFHTYETDWSDEENTVLPESVVRDAETAEKLFPGKKKIIHFMQPHHPFVSSDLVDAGFDDILSTEIHDNEWDLAMRGDLSHEVVKEAYRDNLKLVMPFVEDLGQKLSGKTMVTADHGNLMGENGLYWHPPKSNAKALRKVPMDEI